MSSRTLAAARQLAELVDECDRLIRGPDWLKLDDAGVTPESLPSLLDQVQALTRSAEPPEPVRLLHHLACTGGTLFARCLASMPNTLLLSEVAPHSRLGGPRHSRFHPTDLVRMIRESARGGSVELESEIFLGGLRPVVGDCERRGLRLVLRDHAHSAWCSDSTPDDAPTLRQLLQGRFATRAVVTVRHPLDSWLSLRINRWVHFSPGNLEEYARRYHAFLDAHDDCAHFRYEDLVHEPGRVMTELCEHLALPSVEHFEQLIEVQELSGNSGRSGDRIDVRGRRELPDEVAQEVPGAEAYHRLCERLGYDPRPEISAC